MQAIGVLYLIVLITVIIYAALRKHKACNQDDFEYLTVREQLTVAKETADAIGEAEQLISDMQMSTPNDIIALHLEWIGRDDERHAVELYCNGLNTASENMICIGEREIHDLKIELARQCEILAFGGRHRQNRRQYGARQEGDGTVEEVVSALRNGYLNG